MIDQREEEEAIYESYVWVVGNLCNGFKFHGPYLTMEQAVADEPEAWAFESKMIHSVMSPLHPDHESGMLNLEPKGRPSHLLLGGTPDGGFYLYGPFYAREDAWAWQGVNLSDDDFFVVRLEETK